MSRFTDSKMPNPGSDEALAAGCLCAVLDNCHGKFAPYPPDDWWISEGCPVHSISATSAGDSVASKHGKTFCPSHVARAALAAVSETSKQAGEQETGDGISRRSGGDS